MGPNVFEIEVGRAAANRSDQRQTADGETVRATDEINARRTKSRAEARPKSASIEQEFLQFEFFGSKWFTLNRTLVFSQNDRQITDSAQSQGERWKEIIPI